MMIGCELDNSELDAWCQVVDLSCEFGVRVSVYLVGVFVLGGWLYLLGPVVAGDLFCLAFLWFVFVPVFFGNYLDVSLVLIS